MQDAIREIKKICAESDSGTRVYDWGSTGYKDSVRHYANSSSDVAWIAVQPGSETDLSAIMKVIATYRVAFAVKGGGHSMMPKFSSTNGIQISMSQFNQMVYHETDGTMDIGAGCLWDELHPKAGQLGRRIVGGASEVGVAGYLLGGGYSLRSNQFGLGMDNVRKIRVVLPDGRIVECGKDIEKDKNLFRGMQGGGNNFGVVTQFTIQTHPGSEYFGYTLTFPGKFSDAVCDAIIKFAKYERRPEASVKSTFKRTLENGQPKYEIYSLCRCDGPKPVDPNLDPFKNFLAIHENDWKDDPLRWAQVKQDIDSLGSLSYEASERMAAFPYGTVPGLQVAGGDSAHADGADRPKLYFPSQSTSSSVGSVSGDSDVPQPKDSMIYVGEVNARGRFGCIMISHYTESFVDAVMKEHEKAASYLLAHKGRSVFMEVWPFLDTIFDKSSGDSAWPHKKGEPYAPLLAWFIWENKEDDEFWLGILKTMLDNLRHVALREGITKEDVPYYANYSPGTTPVEEIYRTNVRDIGKWRKQYDPADVMGLAGGFRVPIVQD
ncbi:FAD-binding domain-containing protein [Sistotremastrum suecicum HHB10207 ss-3]|uniref:FAD-binding domain-containing protein n=1 Tax=Sistotremastrum suecicum HHB10207 ss-3 TaxID=1314776 RepID=A0A166ELV7_9AGAM|nr:FAD-binding domain-containing protein [Sistotremastrum suecicum HHB10207 ss-3]